MSKFKLTRSEFSNKLGIPTDTLKKRMRRGQYKDQYIFENGKYLFNGDVKVGPIKAVPKPLSLGTKPRNRGNHFDSKNPNYKPQLRQTNEIRMLAKLKQKKRERLQKSLEQPIRKQYGTGLINMSTNTRDHQNPILYKTRPNLFQTTKRSQKIYKKGPYEI